MNLRTLKKHCRRAMAVLIAEHGYCAADFRPADGEESICAPLTIERQFRRGDWLEPGPLKGTPLLWRKVSYEYDEWDCELPSEFLKDLLFWATFEPDASDFAHAEAA